MPTYITLIRFTQKGIEAIQQGPGRLEATRRAFQARGATIKDFYLVTGKYDAVAVTEAPDDLTAVRLSLAVASRGNSRTETLRAFSEEEYRRIVSDLPQIDMK